MTQHPHPGFAYLFNRLLIASALLSSPTHAQVAPLAPAPATRATPTEEAIVLNPFAVSASSDVGYTATSTLGGTRLKSELRDVASQIDVLTAEFLEDIGALTLEEALRYSMNIESSEENFSPGTDPNTNSVFASNYGGKTRGLSALTTRTISSRPTYPSTATTPANASRSSPVRMPFSSALVSLVAPTTPLSTGPTSGNSLAMPRFAPTPTAACARR